jgi:LPPG:FO 2-phospho-L-lactate transferase
MVVANTGDDFEHLGLAISPDLDTIMYTLAGLADPRRGWGRRDETWTFMAAFAALGGETWFALGDGDLATHVERTRRRAAGEALSAITADFCRRLAIAARLVPMTDDIVRTRLRTDTGWLDFQDYFVRRAVVICPSNPFLSIEPILAVPSLREAIATCAAPVVAVSPIIAGRAVKGPTAKMMSELGLEVSATAVARRYRNLLDAYVLDRADAADIAELGIPITLAHTLMATLADREDLARRVLASADALAKATA